MKLETVGLIGPSFGMASINNRILNKNVVKNLDFTNISAHAKPGLAIFTHF